MNKDAIHRCAAAMLSRGEQPTVEAVSAECQLPKDEVEPILKHWLSQADQAGYDIPQALRASFVRLWQQAVEEASARVALEDRSTGYSIEEVKRQSDDMLQELQHRRQELENRLREQHQKIEVLTVASKSLEAEVSVLKSGLASETTQRKQEEQLRSNVEHELAHLRKAYEDAKRTFDQRIKDEQRHALDAVSKADVDVRYYKNALEKLRDEVGKKESALTREIHDQKAELAKKDVKIETQRTQLRSQEEEVKQLKQDISLQSRELAKCNAALLAEVNKSKRLDDKGRELDSEIRRVKQKQVNVMTDWSRRENQLRSQLKEKEEELMRVQGRQTSLEKRIITQDEEIRRLNARL